MSKQPCLPDHAHWWIIDTPTGPDSDGHCKYCHQSGLFRNSPQHYIYSISLGTHNRYPAEGHEDYLPS